MIPTPKFDESLTKSSFATRMQRLSHNEDFQTLKMRWLDIRIKILEDGKKRKDQYQWAVLDGFDSAVMEIERWLSYAKAEKEEGENDD